MRFSYASLVVTLPVATFASTQFTGNPYLLTSLSAYAPSNTSFALKNSTTASNITVKFTITDPDPLTNTSTTCGATWNIRNGSYPNIWIPCKNTAFKWMFNDWSGVENFGLGVDHSFEDPSVGQLPMDYVTTFARATFNTSTYLRCGRNWRGDVTCGLKGEKAVELPIYAAAA